MNCQEFEDRIQQLLDERRPLDEDALLAEHAQSCPACRRLLDALAAAVATVAAWRQPEPSAGLTDRILEAVQANASEGSMIQPSTMLPTTVAPASRRSNRWRAYVAVAAAAAVVALVSVWGLRPGPAPGVVQEREVAMDEADVRQEPETPIADVDQGEVQIAVIPTADAPVDAEAPATDEFADVARAGNLLLALMGLAPVADSQDGAEVAAPAPNQALNNPMTVGLRQVSDSATGAFGRLLNAFPVDENSRS